MVKRLRVERLTHETNGNVNLSSPKSWESCWSMTSCEAFWSGSWDLGEVERSVIPPESFQKKTSKKGWWSFFGIFSSNASNLRWGVFVRSFAADFLHHSCEGSEVHDYHSTFFNFSLENEWERWNQSWSCLDEASETRDTHLWNVDACSEEKNSTAFGEDTQ